MTATAIRTLDLIESSNEQRTRLFSHTRLFRESLGKAGFSITEGEHPIVPLMLGDASLAAEMAERLLKRGVYAISFSYPVVPMGSARIRFQMSAGHTEEQVRFAIEEIIATGKELEII